MCVFLDSNLLDNGFQLVTILGRAANPVSCALTFGISSCRWWNFTQLGGREYFLFAARLASRDVGLYAMLGWDISTWGLAIGPFSCPGVPNAVSRWRKLVGDALDFGHYRTRLQISAIRTSGEDLHTL
jgi:hypothetical protein